MLAWGPRGAPAGAYREFPHGFPCRAVACAMDGGVTVAAITQTSPHRTPAQARSPCAMLERTHDWEVFLSGAPSFAKAA